MVLSLLLGMRILLLFYLKMLIQFCLSDQKYREFSGSCITRCIARKELIHMLHAQLTNQRQLIVSQFGFSAIQTT